jgi:hypothetical protein
MEFYANYKYDDPKKLIDYLEMHYCRGVSWDIKTELSNATIDEKPIPLNVFNKVLNTDFHTSYLMVPISRFYEVMEIVPMDKKLTFGNVMNAIYDFYHQPLTQEQIEMIKGFPRDVFGYNNDLLNKASEGKVVCFAELRGDSVWFEGIKRAHANIYELRLGS